MTLEEVGLKLRRAWPELKEVQMNNEQLAQFILNRYPRLYHLVSPTAARIKEISERTPSSSRWTEKGRLESVSQQVDINRKEAESMLYMDVAIRAAGAGRTVEGYEEQRQADHLAKLQDQGREHEASIELRLYELKRAIDLKYLEAAEKLKEKFRAKRERRQNRPASSGNRQKVGADIPNPERTTDSRESD